MKNYYLAIDIGASSGRHILGHIEQGKIVLEEIWRFENGMQVKDGSLCWDLPYLYGEIKTGIKKCKELGKIPVSMGIDTWAVDYVLLDENDQVIGKTYGYRDNRTQEMDEEVYKLISESELYSCTGIQKQLFNTIYQLMAVKKQHPEYLKNAKTFLMLPDYFHFLLTGEKRSEYTNATSTQLVNAKTGDWDWALIEKLGYPKEIFLPLSMPGTKAGKFTDQLEEEMGFSCEVVLPATHDTASAIMAVPDESGNSVYISSGTWSLMGIETKTPVCSEESRKKNFTNEGGYDHRFRYLKNIMGLWMIQSLRREMKNAYSFAQLCQLAEENSDFPSRVDVNADMFLAPASMTAAIKDMCIQTGQKVPETAGELAAVVYESLSDSYAETVQELEKITEKKYDSICIVGGGSNADYLNRLTAEKSGKKVLAGPGEATAVGNLLAQMIENKELKNLKEARKCVRNSFSIHEY